MRSNTIDLSQRVRQTAAEHPFLFALGLASRSRSDAARLATQHGVAGDDERRVEDVALFKRDAGMLFGTDFLTALRTILSQQEEEDMKIVWGEEHFIIQMQQWLHGIADKYNLESVLRGTVYVNFYEKGLDGDQNIEANRRQEQRVIYLTHRETQITRCLSPVLQKGRLQPICILVYSPQYLAAAKAIASRWQRRIPKAERTAESVVIVRQY